MSLKIKQVKILNRASPNAWEANGLDSIEVKTVKGYASKMLPLAVTPRQAWYGTAKGEYSITHVQTGFKILENIRLGHARKLIALLEKRTTAKQWEAVIEPNEYNPRDIVTRIIDNGPDGWTPLPRIVRKAMNDVLSG